MIERANPDAPRGTVRAGCSRALKQHAEFLRFAEPRKLPVLTNYSAKAGIDLEDAPHCRDSVLIATNLPISEGHGERGAVRIACVFIPAIVVATSAKTESRSWRRYRGASLSEKALRSSCRPSRCRMLGDRHMDDPPAVVSQNNEHEKQPR